MGDTTSNSKRWAKFLVSITVFMICTWLFAADQPDASASTGTVRMTILGPDQKPVADSRVQITVRPPTEWGGKDVPFFVETDARGVATFDCPAGRRQFQIESMDQIGYAATGVFPVYPGAENALPLPALAPYVSVTGSMPARLAQPDSKVSFNSDDQQNDEVTAPVDAGGKFAAKLKPGRWWASATNTVAEVHSVPFEAASCTPVELTLRPNKTSQDAAATTEPFNQPDAPADDTESTVTGIVEDENGRPLSGATVCIIANGSYWRPYIAASTTSDDHGRYTLKFKPVYHEGAPLILAAKEGYLPARAWCDLTALFSPTLWPTAAPTTRPAPPPDLVRNLRMSSRSGRMDVKVTRNGKPVPNVPVLVERHDGGEVRIFADDIREHLKAAASSLLPEASTDANGVAHFDGLEPARYIVVATDGGHVPQAYWHGMFSTVHPHDEVAFAMADGVPVRAGELCRRDVALRVMTDTVRFHLDMRDDAIQPQPLISALAIEGPSPFDSNAWVDGAGAGSLQTDRVGLWTLYGQFSIKDLPDGPGCPRYMLNRVVADSPLLMVKKPEVITPHRQEAGHLSVSLHDQADKPCKGVVVLAATALDPSPAGSTDSAGTIDFPGLDPDGWASVVRAHVARPNVSALDWKVRENGELLLPNDAELTGRTFIPSQKLFSRPSSATQPVIMREESAAYIRGRIKPAPGDSRSDCACEVPKQFLDAKILEDADTGEFVAGPFRGGPVQISVLGYFHGHTEHTYTFDAIGGRVVRADIDTPRPTPELDDDIWPALVGISDVEICFEHKHPDVGSVVMSDGKTPAAGVLIQGFVRGKESSDLKGVTDSAGIIQAVDALGESDGSLPAAGTPVTPTLVAILPGTTGATVIDLLATRQRPLKIVLPSPIHLVGKLTVGGKSIQPLNAKLRVLAEYQGLGSLNKYLSIDCTPQPDGSFDLSGLTAGTYKVQASIDNIWLSETKTIVAAENAKPDPLTLDIGEPGGPVVVRIRDTHGKPVVGHIVVVDRPTGPLTDRCWPSQFLTDGAGAACIPALETGTHLVHVDGKSHEVVAPRLPCDGPAELVIVHDVE